MDGLCLSRIFLEKIDYYSILQINPDASLEEVRASYRRLALRTHPDKSEVPQATQRMQLVNEAYEVLSSPEKRAQYDRERLASSELVYVGEPSYEDHQDRVDQKYQEELERKMNAWLRNKLRMFSYLILLTTVLFFLSLASGQVNPTLILLIVALAVYIIASMILKVKNLVR
jgi:curved DNA-binding protein CbpA